MAKQRNFPLVVTRIDPRSYKVNNHYVIMEPSGAENPCTCEDFYFRGRESNGTLCKHQVAAKLLHGSDLATLTVILPS